MIAVRRFLGIFQDSPTYGRDRANLITGFSIGTAGLLLNGAVLMLVMPLMLAPDDPAFRSLTDNVEFGQLLAMILLGGATAFATLLIPLRLVTVFWGPRVGRYFDQIVLSGITPLRFVIGKATSQNLFLGLVLFLLLPYLVLSLTLGGVHLGFFVAGLFLVWLYCMALALVTLWASLYLNELLAATLVITAASTFSMLGCIPLRFQPFLMTPFPMLMQPVLASYPQWNGVISNGFVPVFGGCGLGITAFICASLLGISLGPLYGIIRENSTFGEVVREGDSKRKRWFRIRLHIQRSSEIAFFYENRGRLFVRNEGLLRWGIAFFGLAAASTAAYVVFVGFMAEQLLTWRQSGPPWWAFEFHAVTLWIHGLGLVVGMLLFSHSKNTTYLRVPLFRGRRIEVSKLDTTSFLVFALISTAASIAVPFQFDRSIAAPQGISIFPTSWDVNFLQGRQIDFVRISVEGTAVISVAGLVIYAFQRLACLTTWIRSATFALVATLYVGLIGILPIIFAVIALETRELRNIRLLADWSPPIAMVSPMMVLISHFNGGLGPPFPNNVSTVPFYVVHLPLLGATIFAIRRQGRKLRQQYPTVKDQETVDG